MTQPNASNFKFLSKDNPQLARLGAIAEQYFKPDPITCLMKLRQFGELLAQTIAAQVGLYREDEDSQMKLLNRLESNAVLPPDISQLFHSIRKAGNDATHQLQGNHGQALAHLRYARELAIWYYRAFEKHPNFKAGPFIPPPEPVEETESLRVELEKLRQQLQNNQEALNLYQNQATEEAELRQIAEQLLTEAESEAHLVKQRLEELQAVAMQTPQAERDRMIERAKQVLAVKLDEHDTRLLIDQQLRAVGWEVDTETLTYQKGTRPQSGKNLAIAEWPTAQGKADYVLFVGLKVVAVVEAKRQQRNVSQGALQQAQRYSQGYEIKGEEQWAGGPWGDYRVPFVFATNGRPYLQQLQIESGIWYRDVRRPTNIPIALQEWFSPDDFEQKLRQDIDQAHTLLTQEAFNYAIDLRDYQIKAIQAVEQALSEEKRHILLAMATGTGKTKTAIVMVYRLLKTRRFRRILFLVDRKALSQQTRNAFNETRLESLQGFTDIFEVQEVGAAQFDPDIRVQIATVQSFVRRLFDAPENLPPLSPGTYDCIVVDECHRGYLLDQELSDQELQFRSFSDYVSKYRRVLDYFDAVKIGLTATPALHTTQIFGDPIFRYTYRQAVFDGYLIDHDPPTQIRTQLSVDGIIWGKDEEIEILNTQTGTLDLVHAEDEVKFEIEQFNKQVMTESFNRAVCQELTNHIDLSLPGKTLIFCVRDSHADLVVDLLKQAFQEADGSVNDDDIKKITGNTDNPLELIRRFKNESSPKIAVTVDLLTTGIDVPAICNLVFLRRVNSRILYEQMLGRATRRCDEIGKSVFQIFDAVRLYEALQNLTDIKPAVCHPKTSFTQLVDELTTADDPSLQNVIVEQLLAKLRRRQRQLNEATQQQLEEIAGFSLNQLAEQLQTDSPQKTAAWFQSRRTIAEILDLRDGGNQQLLISHHLDKVIAVERGYGQGRQPQDYLEEFQQFLQENLNQIPALLAVTQRPKSLTREDLRELKQVLDAAGFTEPFLQSAWQEITNQDIAASIIGFIRQAALGDALIPYNERVDRAIRKVLSSRDWKNPRQRQWLERIGQQLKYQTILDREMFEQGAFQQQVGGWNKLDKLFDGELATILDEINEALWEEVS